MSAKRQRQLEEQKFLENKSAVIGGTPPVEQVDVIVEGRLV